MLSKSYTQSRRECCQQGWNLMLLIFKSFNPAHLFSTTKCSFSVVKGKEFCSFSDLWNSSFSEQKKERQIGLVTNCTLKNVGMLPFPFFDGACSATRKDIYLCFGHSKEDPESHHMCYRSRDPLAGFEPLSKTKYHHSWAKVSTSESNVFSLKE